MYDLQERTALFGENIIIFCKNLKKDIVIQPLIGQLVRSGTSIGANYMETTAASSKKDFRNKIFICKKESQETKHWLRMIFAHAGGEEDESLKKLRKECQELILIFQKITSSLEKHLND